MRNARIPPPVGSWSPTMTQSRFTWYLIAFHGLESPRRRRAKRQADSAIDADRSSRASDRRPRTNRDPYLRWLIGRRTAGFFVKQHPLIIFAQGILRHLAPYPDRGPPMAGCCMACELALHIPTQRAQSVNAGGAVDLRCAKLERHPLATAMQVRARVWPGAGSQDGGRCAAPPSKPPTTRQEPPGWRAAPGRLAQLAREVVAGARGWP